MNITSTSSPSLSRIATLTGPVTLVPTSIEPDHSVYPALDATFDTATSENVEIAGPRVPICPTGVCTVTDAFEGEDTAMVKFTIVVAAHVLVSREGTIKAEDWAANVSDSPFP